MIRIPPIVWARVQFEHCRINITTFAKQLIGKNPPKGSDVDREDIIHFFLGRTREEAPPPWLLDSNAQAPSSTDPATSGKVWLNVLARRVGSCFYQETSCRWNDQVTGRRDLHQTHEEGSRGSISTPTRREFTQMPDKYGQGQVDCVTLETRVWATLS